MTTKQDILDFIHAAADAYYDDDSEDADKRRAVYLAAGTPGDRLKVEGKWLQSGSAFIEGPKTLDTIIEGIADYLDDQSVSEYKDKINELVSSLNQFIDDYNETPIPIQPTTATKVDPIP